MKTVTKVEKISEWVAQERNGRVRMLIAGVWGSGSPREGETVTLEFVLDGQAAHALSDDLLRAAAAAAPKVGV